MMEAARTPETSVDNFLHGSTSQKTNLNFKKADFLASPFAEYYSYPRYVRTHVTTVGSQKAAFCDVE
jgi:hypothetical protein